MSRCPRPVLRPGLVLWALLVVGVAGCGGGPDSLEDDAAIPVDPGGDRNPVDAPAAARPDLPPGEVAEALRAADQAFRERRYSDAIVAYERILSNFGNSTPQVENIRYSLMEAQYQVKDYDAALDTSAEILDGDPSAILIQRVLQRRYDIGMSFLGGASRRVLGLSVSAEGRGLQILDELVEKYPFQPFADDAVYHIASYYLRRGDYPEAERLFQRLLRDYPDSSWATTAEYRVGEAAYRQLKGVEYDFGVLDTAERRFARYIKLNPDGDQAARARASQVEIEGLRAKRWLKIAEFYIAFDKEDAARVYLLKLVESYPRTSEGGRAGELLEQLEKSDASS